MIIVNNDDRSYRFKWFLFIHLKYFIDETKFQILLIVWLKISRFEIPLVACCGYRGTYNNGGCGGKLPVNGSQIFVGSYEHLRVNWDEIHYSEAANKFVFNQILTRAFFDPLVPLEMACHNIYILRCLYIKINK